MFGSILGAAQLGPWVKKCEDLNSGPQHPYENLGTEAHLVILVLRRLRQDDPHGTLVSQPTLSS